MVKDNDESGPQSGDREERGDATSLASPPRKTLISEAPAPIRFFFNPDRPILLRAGIGLILVAVIFFPQMFKSFSAKKAPTVQPMPRQESMLPPDDVVPENPPAADDSGSTEPATTGSTEPAAIPSPFTRFEGADSAVWIGDAADGSIWIGASRRIIELKEGQIGEPTVRLDPQIYESLFNNELPQLTSFSVDDQGRLWAGAADGELMLYSKRDWKIVWDARDPVRDPIVGIEVEGSSVYVASQGVWRWSEQSGKISRIKAFRDAAIAFLTRSANGVVAVGAPDGIWTLVNEEWIHRYPVEPGKAQLLDAQISSRGEILVASSKGLVQLGNAGEPANEVLSGVFATHSAADRDGNLWVSTLDAGLLVFHEGSWYQLKSEHGLPIEKIALIHIDRRDRIWISGTPNTPMSLFVGRRSAVLASMKSHPYSPKVFDPNAPVEYSTLCRAASTELKAGEASGDISYDMVGDTATTFIRGHQACPGAFGYRRADGAMTVIFGEELQFRIGQKEGTSKLPWDSDEPAVRPKISSILLDSKNRIWIAHSKGVHMYDTTHWTDFYREPNIPNGPAVTIAEDSKGIIWIGTAPEYPPVPPPSPGTASDSDEEKPGPKQDFLPCLFLYTGSTWASLTGREGLPGWYVTDILPLPDGTVAVGMNRGVAIVSEKGVQVMTPKNPWAGLPVVSLARDPNGRLWRAHSYYTPGVSWVLGEDVIFSKDRLKLFSDRFSQVAVDGKNRIWLLAASGQVGIYPLSAFDGPPIAPPEGDSEDEAESPAEAPAAAPPAASGTP